MPDPLSHKNKWSLFGIVSQKNSILGILNILSGMFILLLISMLSWHSWEFKWGLKLVMVGMTSLISRMAFVILYYSKDYSSDGGSVFL